MSDYSALRRKMDKIVVFCRNHSALGGEYEEIIAELVKYLCVLLNAYLGASVLQSLKAVGADGAKNRRHPNFDSKKLEKYLSKQCSQKWKSKEWGSVLANEFRDDKAMKESLDSLYINRNKAAHGRSVDINLGIDQFNEYKKNIFKLEKVVRKIVHKPPA